MDIRAELSVRAEEVNQILTEYLPKEEKLQKTIFEAMNYSLLAGGKRIRPVLMGEAYRMFSSENHIDNGNAVKAFMAAMEMIHTYSLVHDDLPAMDNDEYRRGKKTTHAVYGETMGILAGDALLNYAFETAAEAFDEEGYFKNLQSAMRDSLISAQRVADEATAAAKAEATQMVETAKCQAAKTVADARAEAAQITECARNTADAAKAEYESLKAAAETYRASFRKLVEDQLQALKANDLLFK